MLRSSLLAARSDVRHGFTVGRSVGGDRIDLGRGASPAQWRSVLAELPSAATQAALISQVHGAAVCEATRPGMVGEADAVWTRVRGLPIAVRTADCVPVLVAGTETIAAIHSGWRGTAQSVVVHALRALREAGEKGPLQAAVGPAISGQRYEVGAEVVDGFRRAGIPDEAFLVSSESPRRHHVDVRRAVVWQLRSQGVQHIDTLWRCTFDDPCLHSWRRDGAQSGRMAAVIEMC